MITISIIAILLLSLQSNTIAQVEFTPWGNVKGIRINGELMAFESSLRLVKSQWKEIRQTRHYGLEPSFKVQENRYICSSELDGIAFTEIVEDMGSGQARIKWSIRSDTVKELEGIYFCIEFPENEFTDGMLEFNSLTSETPGIKFSPDFQVGSQGQIVATAGGINITSEKRKINIHLSKQVEILVRKGPSITRDQKDLMYYHVYFTIIKGNTQKNQEAELSADVYAAGIIDNQPVKLVLDMKKQGSKFDGIGGNFLLQFPETDPQAIRYCLNNLNVTWGRIPVWWSDWHPDESMDPYTRAQNGQLNDTVYRQMEMAKTLAKKGIPIIVTVIFPPKWAVLSGERKPGTYGDHLNPAKWETICVSLSKYLLFLKNEYGVEAALFSFNEPDLGIYVLQNPDEHLVSIKMLGRSFISNGLSTKMVLAETSNPAPYSFSFVKAGIDDQEARQYIGAIAFHSWIYCENENLVQWREAASVLNVPLMVTEGGLNSWASRTPEWLMDPAYQHQEIDLYIRICSVCQPLTIMEWQLTAAFSVLTGNGISGTKGPLTATQRFWNLKQLGITPKGSFALPISCDRPNISVAAFGDLMNSTYIFHIVNNGAKRAVTLEGIPQTVKKLTVYCTSFTKNMEVYNQVDVVNGVAKFEIDSFSYTTLINDK